jgi:predicted acetyltransferase
MKRAAMAERSAKISDLIAVVAAPIDRQSAIANLLELYAHDFSEYIELSVGDDGRFGYKSLPNYWSEPTHHPFLIERNGRLAGVALVRRGSRITSDPDVWDMAEFFVMRGHRRHGVGAAAAREIWRALPGNWEVRATSKNEPALAFWRRTISGYAGNLTIPTQYAENGSEWNLFAFESRDTA